MTTRPGGRSARVRDAVLAATRAELAEHGYPALTVDTVAIRAGVHKTTVYRRWGSVDDLLADVLDQSRDTPWQVPDTGTVEGDLIAINTEVAEAFTREGVPTAIVAAALQSPRAATALQAFYAARHEQSTQVVARAISRGELPEGVDAVELVRLACAPLYYRVFMTREPVDAAVAERAARAALAAARAGVI